MENIFYKLVTKTCNIELRCIIIQGKKYIRLKLSVTSKEFKKIFLYET